MSWILSNWDLCLAVFFVLEKLVKISPTQYDDILLDVIWGSIKKVVKKLRIRNYPSIALFHNGKKVEVWKADMDGKVAVTNKDIKKAIDNILAGDVF